MPDPIKSSAEESTLITSTETAFELPAEEAPSEEALDANALAVAANEQAMAVLASRGLLTDSHVTNLSLRS